MKKDLVGLTFNMLTVVRKAEKLSKRGYWECKCECGNLTVVLAAAITRGTTKSCGCYSDKQVK